MANRAEAPQAVTTTYERWGARAVINGKGVYTDLGGAYISSDVWALMTDANDHPVEIVSLLDATGRRISDLVGYEAARIVPGASAGIAMGTAACLSGGDPAAIERLPDTTGLRDGVVIQRAHRYKYLRMAWMAGARIVDAGDEKGTTAEQLEEALDPQKISMLLFVGHLDGCGGTVPIAEATRIASSKGIPTFVDAAFLNYPPETMRRFTDAGAELVCYSAKYWYGPNCGGYVAGRRDLIETISKVDFTRFESGSVLRFGRPFKLDRFAIVGTMASLEEWFARDHGARWQSYERAVAVIARALDGAAGVSGEPKFFTMEETLEASPVNSLVIRVSEEEAGFSTEALHQALHQGQPAVVAHHLDGAVIIAVDAMAPGAETHVAARLRDLVLR